MDWHNVSQWGALLGVLSAGLGVIRFGILPMLKRQRGIDEWRKGSDLNQGLLEHVLPEESKAKLAELRKSLSREP